MKPLSFILAVVIGLMTLAPVPAAYIPAGQGTVSIQAFDVCNSAASGIHAAVPDFILERSCPLCPLVVIGIQITPYANFEPLLIPHQDERPPIA